jgi:TRAP-type C4-dicarboxylate transport system substrate-binding protein
MTFVSGHPPILPWSIHYLKTLIPAIDAELAKENKYNVDWNKAFGGALAKPGEELEAIQEGLADLGQSLTIFEPAKMPLHTVGYAAPFQPNAPGVAAQVMEQLQRDIPELGAFWGKYNQNYLGGGIAADIFNIWSTKPIHSIDDVKGMKLGGAPPTANWVTGTGATHVITGLSENYNNLKSGLVDGVMLFVTGAVPNKYFEVAKYVAVVEFGSTFGGGLTVNKDKWDGYPKEIKDAINVGIGAFEVAFAEELRTGIDKAWDALGKTDSVVYKFPEEERIRWAKALAPLGNNWAAAMEAKGLPGRKVLEGYMNGIRAKGYKFPRDWDKE